MVFKGNPQSLSGRLKMIPFKAKRTILSAGEPIEVACKVTWTNQYAKETIHLRKGMGVKFLDLQPESKKRVEEYIQSHKDKNLFLKIEMHP
jgi:hypothetical protein